MTTTNNSDRNERSETGSNAGKFLTFALSRENYGLEILRVQEIIGVPTITKVPRCAAYIKGVINLRGKIIPVIDLRAKFSLESIPYDEKTCVIVVTIEKADQKIAVGVIVDTVLEVVQFDAQHIEPAPDYGTSLETKYIIGMGRKNNDKLNILLNIERILADSEAVSIAIANDT
jgi:purine-binding chemotaxis protein CheW